VGWCRDHTERLIGWVAGHGVDDLQIVHGRGDRHRRVTELAQDGEFQVAVAFVQADGCGVVCAKVRSLSTRITRREDWERQLTTQRQSNPAAVKVAYGAILSNAAWPSRGDKEPIPVVRETTIEPQGSTYLRHSYRRQHRHDWEIGAKSDR
jgi:hypothetical protein